MRSKKERGEKKGADKETDSCEGTGLHHEISEDFLLMGCVQSSLVHKAVCMRFSGLECMGAGGTLEFEKEASFLRTGTIPGSGHGA